VQGRMPEIYHPQPREDNTLTIGVKDFTSCLVVNDQSVDSVEDRNINHNGNFILSLYLSSRDSIDVRMDILIVCGMT
jgi:hypothetical protein